MIVTPLLPAWLLILGGAVLGGYCLVMLVRVRRGGALMWALRLVIVLATVFAAFRPAVGAYSAATANADLDVVFVVDTTASMAAEDGRDSRPRLQDAREDVSTLAAAHAGARFALITFDSTAIQRLPLTTDVSALELAMNVLRTENPRYSQGSSIGLAAPLLQRLLTTAADADPDRARIVYYLGDGEQTAQSQPESFTEVGSLIQGGSVLGYGTEAGAHMREDGADPDPTFSSGRYVRDPQTGKDAVSRLDETALKQIAQEMRVEYQHRSGSGGPAPASVEGSRMQIDPERSAITTFPLYWIGAVVAAVALVLESWRLAGVAARLRRAGKEPA